MPKGKKRSYKGKSELLEWRLKFEATDDRYPTLEAFTAAVERSRMHFMATGEDLTNGVHVVGIWQNPDRRIPGPVRTTDDAGQSQKGFFNSIVQHTGSQEDEFDVDEDELEDIIEDMYRDLGRNRGRRKR